MPDVRNCRRCGKIFNYIGGPPICPACREMDEEDYKRVKEYLYQHPGASMTEVSTTLDVSIEKLKRFLKEGRLEIVGDDPNFVLECEICGKSIRTGRFCDACERDKARDFRVLADQISSSLGENERLRKGIGLRYLSKDDKDKI